MTITESPVQDRPGAPGADRLGLAGPLFVVFVVVSAFTRLGLAAFNADTSLFEPLRLGPAVLLGLSYDVAVALWWCLSLVLLGWWWPAARARSALGVVALVLTTALLGGLVFVSVAEFVFWNEFASRFNFIAVDYLLYTREVIGNIRESDRLTPRFAGIGAATLLPTLALARCARPGSGAAAAPRRCTSPWPPP